MDKITDEKFREIAGQYMKEMGYWKQPFVVFKHTDTDRAHIHIVSVCVNETGKKISDKFEKRRSMNVCRELERQYNLITATNKEHKGNDKIFRPVNYKKSDVKNQIASVVRYLPKYYKFQSFGEYNALLSLFNITTEKVEADLMGKPRQGLLYFALNNKGRKMSKPFKSSLFGKQSGLPALERHFERSKEILKDSRAKLTIKAAIREVMASSGDEHSFKNQLAAVGVNVTVRRNSTGRIYGITFIDHNSKTVWNGSRLGRKFSANVFNDYWNNNSRPEMKGPEKPKSKMVRSNLMEDISFDGPHELFNFLYQDTSLFTADSPGIIESLGGLLPEAQGEDYGELDFENRMMKRKKKRRRKQ